MDDVNKWWSPPPNEDHLLDKININEQEFLNPERSNTPIYTGQITEEMCRSTAVMALFAIINDPSVRTETRVQAIAELRLYLNEGGVQGIKERKSSSKKTKIT